VKAHPGELEAHPGEVKARASLRHVLNTQADARAKEAQPGDMEWKYPLETWRLTPEQGSHEPWRITVEVCKLILETRNFRFGNLGFTLLKIQKRIELPKGTIEIFNTYRQMG
jgi:hypothetical protein